MICDFFEAKDGDIVRKYKYTDLLGFSVDDYRAGTFKIPCFDGKTFFVTDNLRTRRTQDGIEVLLEKDEKSKLYPASHRFLSSEQLKQFMGFNWRQTDLPYGLVFGDEREKMEERPYVDLCASIDAIAVSKQKRFDIPATRVDAENSTLYLPVTAKHRNLRWIDGRTPVSVPKENIKKKNDAVYTVTLPADGLIEDYGCWGEAVRPVTEIAERMRAEARSAENKLKKRRAKENDPGKRL